MSVIYTDSDCELWYDQLDKLGVRNIEMPYSIGNQEYMYDLGKTTDFKDFYNRLRKGERSMTSALNAQDYTDIFEPVFKAGEDVLYICFSLAMSGTFNQLRTAIKELKEKYPERKFTMFNTKSISYASGIQVVEAAKLKAQGLSDEEIVEKLKDFTQRVCCYFIVDDLMHLKRGGRLGATAAFAGSILKLKPVLTFDGEGSLKVVNKIMGRKNAINFLIKAVEENAVEGDYDNVILDADCREEAEKMQTDILSKRPDVQIRPQTVGPVIGSHCGPGLLGVVYIGEKRVLPINDVESCVEIL